MTAREFDPVLSAALRDELEHRAASARRPAGPRAPERRRLLPALVTVVTAVAVLAATLGVLATTGTRHPAPAASTSTSTRSAGTLLHRSGRGDADLGSVRVPVGVTSLRVALSCSPASQAAVHVGEHLSEGCAEGGGHLYDFTPDARTLPVRVVAGDGIRWTVLLAPTPGRTVEGRLRLPSALPFPADAATSPRHVVGRARGGEGTTVRGRLSAPVHSLSVVTTCQGRGTLVIATSDGFTSGSAAESPNAGVCSPGRPKRFSYGLEGDHGLEQLGRLRYRIVPVGQVVWTVTFAEAG